MVDFKAAMFANKILDRIMVMLIDKYGFKFEPVEMASELRKIIYPQIKKSRSE